MDIDDFTGEGMKVRLTQSPDVEHCLCAHLVPNSDWTVRRRSDWGDNPVIFVPGSDVLQGASRIEKAGFIVLLRSIQELKYRRHYRVGAEDGLRTYDVINGHCECSDYVRHGPGHPCKHRLAIELYEVIGSALSPSIPGQNETGGHGSPEYQRDDYI